MCDGQGGGSSNVSPYKSGSGTATLGLGQGPAWSSGDRMMPQTNPGIKAAQPSLQSMMPKIDVNPYANMPYAPGGNVVQPTTSAPQATPGANFGMPESMLHFGMQGSDGQPIQIGGMTVGAPMGDGSTQPQPQSPSQGSISIDNPMGDGKPTGPVAAPTPSNGSITVGNPEGDGGSKYPNNADFKQAATIQNSLPQIQSPNSQATQTVSSNTVAQAPTQQNPSASTNVNPAQANDQALDFVMNKLEGAAPFKEQNGRTSVYGIGSNPNETTPKSLEDAKQQYNQLYIANHPQRQAVVSQLTNKKDLAAYHQALLLQSGKTDQFTNNYKGQVGGDQWRNALLNNQAVNLNKLAQNPQYSKFAAGWNQRIKDMRSWNPDSGNV